MERWRAPTVLAWLEVALGMPQYGARCAENIKSGKASILPRIFLMRKPCDCIINLIDWCFAWSGIIRIERSRIGMWFGHHSSNA